MSFDFHDQGVYNTYAMINVSFTGSDGTTYVGSTNTYNSIELAGISSEFSLAKETNELDQITKLVATFTQNEAMSINHRRAAEYPYIENENGQRTYFDSHNFVANELELTLGSPLSETGNYRLVIPEQYVYHLYDNGAIAVPNKYEVSQNFAVGSTSDNSALATPLAETDTLFDMYNAQGLKVASRVDPHNPGAIVSPGLYILTNGHTTHKLRIP